jgi:hypothetical protein
MAMQNAEWLPGTLVVVLLSQTLSNVQLRALETKESAYVLILPLSKIGGLLLYMPPPA